MASLDDTKRIVAFADKLLDEIYAAHPEMDVNELDIAIRVIGQAQERRVRAAAGRNFAELTVPQFAEKTRKK